MTSREERKGKRGHEDGNVRPADDRYGLHEPEQESEFIRSELTADETPGPSAAPTRAGRGRKKEQS